MNILDEKFVDLVLGIRIFSIRECFMYIINYYDFLLLGLFSEINFYLEFG